MPAEDSGKSRADANGNRRLNCWLLVASWSQLTEIVMSNNVQVASRKRSRQGKDPKISAQESLEYVTGSSELICGGARGLSGVSEFTVLSQGRSPIMTIRFFIVRFVFRFLVCYAAMNMEPIA